MLYPVPPVMVSCGRPKERPNIITIAWTGTVCSEPPMLSISVRPSRYSYAIIKETGEFAVNLTTEALAEAADFCGVKSGRDTDKFSRTGLTPGMAAHLKAAPIILESPVNIECRVTEVKPLGSHDLFLAEVLGVDVDERLLDENGRLDLNAAGLAAWSHGTYMALGRPLGKFGFSVKKQSNKRKKTEE